MIGELSNKTGFLACRSRGRSLRRCRIVLFLLLSGLVLLSPLRADKLIMHDGRIVEGCRIVEKEQGLFAVFEHGTLKLVPSQIREFLYDSTETYVPRNEYEREQLANGFVLFEGLWMSTARRESVLKKRLEDREAKVREARSHLAWDNAWRKENAHFELISNTSDHLFGEHYGLFDQFYDVFTKKWKIPGKHRIKVKKPVIKIYRNRASYHATGAPASSAGLFNFVTNELWLYYDAADPRFTLDVLFHEGTHLMVHLLRPDFRFPIWVNEGLAEYYGSSLVSAKGSVKTGIIQEGRLVRLRNALETGKYIPLERMVLTEKRKFGSLHYAEAWCLVHYLLEHEKYDSKFKSFIQALATGTGFREVRFGVGRGKNASTVTLKETLSLFKKKMGVNSLEKLESEYLDYVTYGLPDAGMRGYVILARISMRDGAYDDALEATEIALDMGSRDPNCYLYRGRIFAVKERYEQAVVALQRAIERDPLNPYFHAEQGRILRESEDPTMMAEGVREYYLATEIAPGVSAFRSMLDKALKDRDLPAIRKRKAKNREKLNEPPSN